MFLFSKGFTGLGFTGFSPRGTIAILLPQDVLRQKYAESVYMLRVCKISPSALFHGNLSIALRGWGGAPALNDFDCSGQLTKAGITQ